MTEEKLPTPTKPVAQESDNSVRQLLTFLVILGAALIWSVYHPGAALRVLLVLLGFGGIVMVHEFGHFIVAKLGGIKVEAFSIGFPPVVLGIRKLKKGWRVRVLPKIGQAPELEEGDSETEYQVGLFPVGGFVKMLGQSDTGSAEANDDPRSFANRPVAIRMAVIAAGVVFNAIGAVLIFMALFMNGINLKPAVVGHVMQNSPAYDAGLRSGDRIIEINGERFVNFEAVQMAPALSAPGEPVSFIITRNDGVEQEIKVIAEKRAGDNSKLRYTGIAPAQTLTIEPQIAKSEKLTEEIYELTGLRPGDEVKAINGKPVSAPWEFSAVEAEVFKPKTTVTVSRQWPAGSSQHNVTVEFPITVMPMVENFREELDLAHFGTMAPRLKVAHVDEPRDLVSLPRRTANWFRKTVLGQELKEEPKVDGLMVGDVIVKIADQEYPTYKQLREVTVAYKDKDVPITVERKDASGQIQTVNVTMQPRTDLGTERVVMGIVPSLDMDSPVLAQTVRVPQLSNSPEIPAGATITAINDTLVTSFFEVASALQANAGQKVTIRYEHAGQAAETSLNVPSHEPVHAQASLAVGMPFKELTEEFKASNPIEAVQMGMKKAWQFVWQSYVTLGRLFQGSVAVSALSGPVGIISMTYQVAGASAADYLYFLGLISSCLAVMNLLPLPVLDGGHLVILLIEKISGKPLNEKVLAGAMYAGMAFLLGLILFITFNDLKRVFFG